MTLKTRALTGKPNWPITLMAGVQKAGKTHAAVEASASPLIGRTIWFTCGEDNPDEFLNIETPYGAPKVELALYDGTYRGLLTAMQDAAAEPNDPAKPNLWVLDSGTKLWNLLTDMAQTQANRRWASRKANQGKEIPADGVTISMDLWTVAKNRWHAILELMRQHQGPSIITARLELVNVVNDKGDPTGEKFWKVQAEKSLAFDVGVVMELRAIGEACITGVRSVRYRGDRSALVPFPEFTMDKLWRKLGLADGDVGTRQYVGSTGDESQAADELLIAKRHALLEEIKAAAAAVKVTVYQIAHEWADSNGHPIQETTDLGQLTLLRDDYRGRANLNRQDAVA